MPRRKPREVTASFRRCFSWKNSSRQHEPHPISQTSLTNYTQTSLDTGKNGRHPRQMHDFTATYVLQ